MPPGTFWDILRHDGSYAAGIVLQNAPVDHPGHTRMFLAGLLDWTGDAPPSVEQLVGVKLVRQGFAHIFTIVKNGGMVRGCIDLDDAGLEPMLTRNSEDGPNVRLVQGYIDMGPAKARPDWRSLPICSTWGYRVIVKLAEQINSKHA